MISPSGQQRQDRDRDVAGRPRNARPRDGLGRPLDRTATGEPVTPADLRLAPGEALPLAQRLIDDDRPFHAHEVLELAWKTGPEAERGLWKGLAQVAVGLTHARRGNRQGAAALLRRGATAIADYDGALPDGFDLAGTIGSARALADQIDRSGPDRVPAEALRLRLVTRG